MSPTNHQSLTTVQPENVTYIIFQNDFCYWNQFPEKNTVQAHKTTFLELTSSKLLYMYSFASQRITWKNCLGIGFCGKSHLSYNKDYFRNYFAILSEHLCLPSKHATFRMLFKTPVTHNPQHKESKRTELGQQESSPW